MTTSQTHTAAAGRGRAGASGPGAGKYVPPSLCDLCWPAVRVVSDGYCVTITEAAHEAGCPNHPQHKESSAW